MTPTEIAQVLVENIYDVVRQNLDDMGVSHKWRKWIVLKAAKLLIKRLEGQS
jgi:hypothetical protein